MVTVTSAPQKHIFDDAQIIVIKVGSSLLVDEDHNAINTAWLSGIATDIARLKAAGKDVVVVSSGAIALGRRLLKINHKAHLLSPMAEAALPQRSHLWTVVSHARKACGLSQ